MRALVVYESMYGNTRRVAQAIAEGLGEATLVEVGEAPTTLPSDVGLLVVGGPTHVHGMSRERSRHDAAKRVDTPVESPTIGIREWLDRLQPGEDLLVATFDTRIDKPAILTGSAAKSAAGTLRHRARLVGTASFVLDKGTGDVDRIAPAELERARTWGRTLAEHLPVAIG